MSLLQKTCTPCEGGTPPLPEEQIVLFTKELTMDWSIVNGNTLSREFRFKNFNKAMVFVDAVAYLAEAEGHHPDIHIQYNKVRIELSTHAIRGLSENDFILARKIEDIFNKK